MDPRDFDPGPLAAVECIKEGDTPTLVFVRDLRHSPDRVWTALTDPQALGQWAPYTADRDLGSTGPVTLTMLDGDKPEPMSASVMRVEPPTLLEYSWGDAVLEWRLDPTDSGTRLTLRHTVDAIDWVPKAAAGWHLCLVVAEHMLDGQPIGRIVGADAMRYGWQDLHDEYAGTMGIEGTPLPDDITSRG